MKTRKNVKIRLINNGVMTKWRSYGIKLHRTLMENPPDKVVIRLRDFYPDTPDHVTQIVDFPVFHVLSRETFLREEALEKELERHIDDREMDDTLLSDEAQTLADSAETEMMLRDMVRSVLSSCSEIQKERFVLYVRDGYRLEEIAAMQRCNVSAVHKSVHAILKKLKLFLA